jgi:pyruvate dehydrogenase E2 component (dihydrolipoamide acetyltransferase)|tara:strand:+ start:10934 stop:12205 length:1272 start_codon:yes stop_codon:yes gene_type:complete
LIKELILPNLGEGIEGAEVSEISVSIGDKVSLDDTVLVLESDKASMEIPAENEGIVKEILVSVGETVKTGQALLKIKHSDEKTDKKEPKEKPLETKTSQKSTELPLAAPTPTIESELQLSGSDTTNNVFASPGVRRLSRELGINLQVINGTGEKGRITKDDLNGYIKIQMLLSNRGVPKPEPEIDFSKWGNIERQKLTKIQRITGQRLQSAWQSIPHVTQFDEADITELSQYRKNLNEKNTKKKTKLTFLPFLMKAISKVLRERPVFNSSLDTQGENLIIKNYYNIGVAVDTPTGLVVPVVSGVDKKNIYELSEELIDISQRARNKKLKPKEMTGGTFTISSLGGVGGKFFTPIINPPEVAILGVSKSWWESIYDQKTKKQALKYIMPFSLSYDHRVIDGVAGAAFTKRFSNLLSDLSTFQEK